MSRLRYSANMSMLFGDLPLQDQPAAAALGGFAHVESWWPFPEPVPPRADVDGFCSALEGAGVQLVALNLDAGDQATGQRGLLSLPTHRTRVDENLEVAAEILERTGCRLVNALFGNREPQFTPEVQELAGLRGLIWVADRVAPLGAIVVVETLNRLDNPAFPLTDIAVTAALVGEVNAYSRDANAGLLLDTYHVATMGTDPTVAIREHAELIRHVQFADAPGRGRPGTGGVDFAAVEQALTDIGYDGFVGLEYYPSDPRREGIA